MATPAAELELTTPPGSPALLHVDAPDAVAWAGTHSAALGDLLIEHGAVLVRGLALGDTARVEEVSRALAGPLMPEREGFASRDRHADGLYSSSKWPTDQPMCMHHELSYALEFPGTMLFACLTAARSGGVTGVADSGAVLDALPAELVDRFERQGWQLTRNYNEMVGVPWQEAFGTEDAAEVERHCRANHIEFSWDDVGGLRTTQRRAAILHHPVTGKRAWFNQVAFLNKWTIDPDVRDYLTMEFGPDGLPFNSRFGDGTPLTEDIVELINNAYARHTVGTPWQAGDLLLVDNIARAHSREPYTGAREVLVALGAPVRAADCQPTIDLF